jgi:hypothetical protein
VVFLFVVVFVLFVFVVLVVAVIAAVLVVQKDEPNCDSTKHEGKHHECTAASQTTLPGLAHDLAFFFFFIFNSGGTNEGGRQANHRAQVDVSPRPTREEKPQHAVLHVNPGDEQASQYDRGAGAEVKSQCAERREPNLRRGENDVVCELLCDLKRENRSTHQNQGCESGERSRRR